MVVSDFSKFNIGEDIKEKRIFEFFPLLLSVCIRVIILLKVL